MYWTACKCMIVATISLSTLSAGSLGRAAETPAAGGGKAAWAPPFYVLCLEMGVPGLKPRPLVEQAELLRELGFDGGAYELWFGDQLDENLKALDRGRAKLYMLYTSVNLNKPDRPYDPRLPEAFSKLKGRPVTICVLLSGFPPGDPRGMEPAVKVLRELGDLGAKSGLRISIYHHNGIWAEAVPFALKVIEKVGHPNVGVNFNVPHWLLVEGEKDYRPVLRENIDKIFGVTISGGKRGPNGWKDEKTQPLDQGDFDARPVVDTLRVAGYRGPIGLMCFGVGGDARDHLSRSMKVWKSWLAER